MLSENNYLQNLNSGDKPNYTFEHFNATKVISLLGILIFYASLSIFQVIWIFAIQTLFSSNIFTKVRPLKVYVYIG